jgi:hypothetical protein
LDTAGRLTGLVVFVVGVVLLGLVFRYTVDTVGAAETAVRRGDLTLPPLFGAKNADVPPPALPDAPVAEEGPAGTRRVDDGGSRIAKPSDPGATKKDEPLSPLVRFGIAVGARIIGLCALGFIAGIIATQGARMCGAFGHAARKDPVP